MKSPSHMLWFIVVIKAIHSMNLCWFYRTNIFYFFLHIKFDYCCSAYFSLIFFFRCCLVLVVVNRFIRSACLAHVLSLAGLFIFFILFGFGWKYRHHTWWWSGFEYYNLTFWILFLCKCFGSGGWMRRTCADVCGLLVEIL